MQDTGGHQNIAVGLIRLVSWSPQIQVLTHLTSHLWLSQVEGITVNPQMLVTSLEANCG